MSNDLARLDQADVTVASVEAQALAAVEAIDNVSTADEAEELLRRVTAYQQVVKLAQVGREQERRWSAVRLMAERKMGELLGPVEKIGGDRVSEQFTPSEGLAYEDRQLRYHARRVAAIPEDTFSEYVVSADEPSRAGLLRAARTVAPADERPTAEHGERLLKAQAKLVAGVAEKARRINELAPHLDLDVVHAITQEEKDEWKQQLSTARTALSRLIAAL